MSGARAVYSALGGEISSRALVGDKAILFSNQTRPFLGGLGSLGRKILDVSPVDLSSHITNQISHWGKVKGIPKRLKPPRVTSKDARKLKFKRPMMSPLEKMVWTHLWPGLRGP